MKLNKVSKILVGVGLGCVITGLVGCASVSGFTNNTIKNDSEGIIYGVRLDTLNVKEICSSIKDKDDRCLNPSQYQAVAVAASFGFNSGFNGIFAFADKNLSLGNECLTGSKNCTYLKVKVDKGRFGNVLEVLPKGACEWNGMPRAGGTVCQGLYDYRKDFNGITN